MKSRKNISLYLGILILLFTGLIGCQKDWLDEQPLSAVSEASFWTNRNDAMLALMGCYRNTNFTIASYNNEHLCLTSATDDSNYKESAVGDIYTGYFLSSDGQVVQSIWNRAYTTIFRCNYFLANIDRVKMDDAEKKQMTAEVKFIRAYEYFYMSVMYGGVPLITKVLTIEESNKQVRNTYDEIVNFCLTELADASADLPASRPAGEKGRILKAAAYAIKGRLQMINKKWGDAASSWKAIMDLNVHIIDPSYKDIFEEKGENSKEIILAANCLTGLYPNANNQTNYKPQMYGGYQECGPTQELVDAFWMADGKTIDESPLYDPAHPFDNRDPRFYDNFFLPEYTVWQGILYLGHPDRTDDGIKTIPGATGYCFKKFASENYAGGLHDSGDDIIHIRYAEVLLSYLESRIENNDPLDQTLLDATINKLRTRASVNMPAVTELDRTKLRDIVRRERRIELCFEKDMRYMDIRRWGIFMQVMNKPLYGMKLTDNPDTYTAFAVEKVGRYRGHFKAIDKTGTYKAGHALLPIPLYEIQINPNLIQNPDYN
jgi:starch-binding outer membrane protein, SusD/RagB family